MAFCKFCNSFISDGIPSGVCYPCEFKHPTSDVTSRYSYEKIYVKGKQYAVGEHPSADPVLMSPEGRYRLKVRFFDGRIIESNNIYQVGLTTMPDNAEFLEEDSPMWQFWRTDVGNHPWNLDFAKKIPLRNKK